MRLSLKRFRQNPTTGEQRTTLSSHVRWKKFISIDNKIRCEEWRRGRCISWEIAECKCSTFPATPPDPWLVSPSLFIYFSTPGALWPWKSDPGHWGHFVSNNTWLNRLVGTIMFWYTKALLKEDTIFRIFWYNTKDDTGSAPANRNSYWTLSWEKPPGWGICIKNIKSTFFPQSWVQQLRGVQVPRESASGDVGEREEASPAGRQWTGGCRLAGTQSGELKNWHQRSL